MPLALLCCLSLLCAGTGEDDCPSYLIRCPADTSHCQRYVPQAGDLVFFDKPSRLWDLLDWFAGTKPPDHLAMVVAMPDGSTRLFEAGPDADFYVFLSDIHTRISGYKGRVYVRRLRCPLSPEQSCALTDFAVSQEGKRYSLLRLARQITPLRTRGPVRTKLFAATIIDRRRWICSDMIIAAGTVAGLFDARVMPASAVYARDIINDQVYDLSCLYEPVARWSPCPIDADIAANFVRLRPMFTKPD
jgi:hypothetical protein